MICHTGKNKMVTMKKRVALATLLACCPLEQEITTSRAGARERALAKETPSSLLAKKAAKELPLSVDAMMITIMNMDTIMSMTHTFGWPLPTQK